MDQIIAFFQNNEGGILAFSNFLIMLIWLVYLTLFYIQYRKSSRLKVVITSIDTPKGDICMIVNLSPSTTYIENVQVILQKDDSRLEVVITDALSIRRKDSTNASSVGTNRTLAAADSITLGKFSDLVESARDTKNFKKLEEIAADFKVTVRVTMLVAAHDEPIAVYRSFILKPDFHVDTVDEVTKQIGFRTPMPLSGS